MRAPSLHASEYGPRMLRAQQATHAPPNSVGQLILGGGTLIGRWDWSARFSALCELFPDADRWTIGAGVEDPDSLAVGSHDLWKRDLQCFSSVANSFLRISVRGPRSQATLAAIGIDVPWVGDPALLLQPVAPTVDV